MRLRQDLTDRLTGDHQPLPHGLRLPQFDLEDFHPLPGSPLPLFQQPHHRRHPGTPPQRRHDTSSRPDGLQWLLARSPWDEDAMRDRIRGYVLAGLGDPAAALIADETGDIKKGT